jgi:hypothetical protein
MIIPGRVTIGIPVYRRRDLLPRALACVRAQDYPDVDLLVSDNGASVTEGGAPESERIVRAIVEEHYPRSYRYRQNPETVPVQIHFNQLVEAAEGEYFTLLADDDEISGDFVSELVSLFGRHPKIRIALPRHVSVLANGEEFKPGYDEPRPEVLGDEEFIHAWSRNHYNLFSVMLTNLARTEDVRRFGGYLNWPRGSFTEDALLLKLCLGAGVGMGQKCWFHWNMDGNSTGIAAPPADLANNTREFLTLVDTDPVVQAYARAHPTEWRRIRPALRREAVEGYTYMMQHTYYNMRFIPWLRAAFDVPFVSDYYSPICRTMVRKALLDPVKAVVRRTGRHQTDGADTAPSTP